jgi:hypothetical protein
MTMELATKLIQPAIPCTGNAMGCPAAGVAASPVDTRWRYRATHRVAGTGAAMNAKLLSEGLVE